MLRVLFLFALALVGCEKAGPSKLEVYIAEKEARPGLHPANFPGFTDLGYVPEKPDLTISKLEKVTFPPVRLPGGLKPPAGAASEDRSALVLQLTKSDADALSELTKKHIGDRLVVLLNNEPLFAPEIRTPSIGEDVYIQPATGTDTIKVKAKLEKLAQKRD